MIRPPRHINVDHHGDVHCVCLRNRQLSEKDIVEMAEEVISLITDDGCRKLVFSLGPGSPETLYSVFLAKLVMIQRRLREFEGRMKLCDVTPEVYGVFKACQLHDHFEFCDDKAAAIAAFNVPPAV